MGYRKKLIEVAIPLEPINAESERDKYLSWGHPTTLHYWWAPRPLAACRAVVFASLVDDPSEHPERFPTEEDQQAERARLFDLIARLVKWESRCDESILRQAREEIAKSADGETPRLVDPFCGRGLIPLEGQRLGLDVAAADLNPVAALIAKVLLETVPSFLGQPPVNAEAEGRLTRGAGTEGFVEDAEYYARQVLETVAPSLRPLFPEYQITDDLAWDTPELEPFVGERLTIMGWLWARTVRCQNPGCNFTIPMVGQLWLSKKKGKKVHLEPVLDRDAGKVGFSIVYGSAPPSEPTKIPNTSGSFKCPACNQVSTEAHLEAEGEAGRIGQQLIACIADAGRGHGRVYLPATEEQEACALDVTPRYKPDHPISDYAALPGIRHGIRTWGDLFTDRQAETLSVLADAVRAMHDRIRDDALAAGLPEDPPPLREGGRAAGAYADAMLSFLGLVLGKYVNRSCNFCFWHASRETIEQPFAQQGVQKTWDFVETNPLSGSSGSWQSAYRYPLKVLQQIPTSIRPGEVRQQDVAQSGVFGEKLLVITDPPYYANVGYADLSDFFYVWLRQALEPTYPSLFSTVFTPKAEEITALPHRFGGDRSVAEDFFVGRFERAFARLSELQHPDYPLCLFYAYREKETNGEDAGISTGWETMLRGLLRSGLMVVGTWPVRSESTATIKKGRSFLSTSIVLVCRRRPEDAPMSTRRDFARELRERLPQAITRLREGNIAPVDLAQAAIGPGMAVFSKYARVLESDGTDMSVRTALGLIVEVVEEVLTEQESDFDRDTRWAVAWFEQHGMEEGPYGEAETLSKAKNVSVGGIEEAGIIATSGGKVRLLKREELGDDWDPVTDERPTVWEMTQHLTRRLQNQGEAAAAELLARIGTVGEVARDLAYRLYTVAERNGWAKEALAYNSLVVAWPELSRLTRQARSTDEQIEMLSQG